MKKVLFYLFTLLISTNIVFAEHLDNEMNVMSFNIRMSTKSDGANWGEYRKDLAANVIKFYDVDMFGSKLAYPVAGMASEILFGRMPCRQPQSAHFHYARRQHPDAGPFPS